MTGKFWGCFVDRDYQFKELFFPHTYGFILSKYIGMQIRLSRAPDTRVLHARMHRAAAGIRRRNAHSELRPCKILSPWRSTSRLSCLANARSITNITIEAFVALYTLFLKRHTIYYCKKIVPLSIDTFLCLRHIYFQCVQNIFLKVS